MPQSDPISEYEIPTDVNTWIGCCDHRDCWEAVVNVEFISEEVSSVRIDNHAPVLLGNKIIYPSLNGRDYYCRYDIEEPPSTENIRCVFDSKGRYTQKVTRPRGDP